ncbi:hypothetical protein HW509_14125 [Asaia spathodeae]|uniref:hypothetical protein n=1 Tax=Asaia spathodeae TaxID=657016 RepID=UPI002FC2C102
MTLGLGTKEAPIPADLVDWGFADCITLDGGAGSGRPFYLIVHMKHDAFLHIGISDDTESLRRLGRSLSAEHGLRFLDYTQPIMTPLAPRCQFLRSLSAMLDDEEEADTPSLDAGSVADWCFIGGMDHAGFVAALDDAKAHAIASAGEFLESIKKGAFSPDDSEAVQDMADLIAEHETRRFSCLIAANPRQSTGAIQ